MPAVDLVDNSKGIAENAVPFFIFKSCVGIVCSGTKHAGRDCMGLKIVERIDKDLQGLIPGFMEITHKEINELEQALVEGDMSVAARIGHNLKGSALNYGFVYLGDIGRRIESEAAQNRQKKVQAELELLKDYVDRVEVTFV